MARIPQYAWRPREVGVDCHLPAGHRVQRESGGDLGDADRAMIDDDILNGDQDEEDHRADDVIATDHEAPEGSDHLARG